MTNSKQYWAKTHPWQSVGAHGLISGHVAQVLFDHYLTQGIKELLEQELHLDTIFLREILGYFVSLHDIGKIAYNFQSKDLQTKNTLSSLPENFREIYISGVRHERTGEKCANAIWRKSGELTPLTRIAVQAIGAHHPGKTGPDEFNQNSVWFERQNSFEAQMRAVFLKNKLSLPPNTKIAKKGVIGSVMLAVLILSDWIASSTSFEHAEDWIENDDAESKIITIANQFLDKSGLRPHKVSWPVTFSTLWSHILNNKMRPLQIETELLFSKSPQRFQLVLLEAPMGEGKTEAGVFAALRMSMQWKKNGFYLAMPTAATANQMVERMRALFQEHTPDSRIRLLHSMSWLNDSEKLYSGSYKRNDEMSDWLAPLRRGLLAQYAVGTVDQVMLAATTVKFGALRLLGLSGKVLIIDEIHSYDAYMSVILQRLLDWCKAMKIPVVMLSATLPPQKKQEMFSAFTDKPLSHDYPLITAICEDGSVCEHKISGSAHHTTASISLLPILDNPRKIADTAIECVQSGGSVCILMNTVREAQNVYMELKQCWKGDLLLFHAQFPAKRRKEIEEECVKRYGKNKSFRPIRSILVATQVVEQSLDVDFDAMYSACAPIDLLLQRLGRVHRHDFSKRPANLKTPLFGVLIPPDNNSFGPSSFVYPECLLKSSVRILGRTSIIRIPDDIPEMVRNGYDVNEVPQEELNKWLETFEEEIVTAGSSTKFLANSPEKEFRAFTDDLAYSDHDGRLTVKTRLGEPSVRISLLDNEDFAQFSRYIEETGFGTPSQIKVYNRNIAEMVMENSLTISLRLFNSGIADVCTCNGGALLSGVRIINTKNGCVKLPDGKVICNDPELGFLIKECEK